MVSGATAFIWRLLRLCPAISNALPLLHSTMARNDEVPCDAALVYIRAALDRPGQCDGSCSFVLSVPPGGQVHK